MSNTESVIERRSETNVDVSKVKINPTTTITIKVASRIFIAKLETS